MTEFEVQPGASPAHGSLSRPLLVSEGVPAQPQTSPVPPWSLWCWAGVVVPAPSAVWPAELPVSVCPCVRVSMCPWADRNRNSLLTLPLADLSPKGLVTVSSLPTNAERWFEEKKQSALKTNSSNSWLYILYYCGSSCPSRGRAEHGPVPVPLCRSRRWLLGVCSKKSRAWPQQALGDQGDSSLSLVWGRYETWLNSAGTRSAGELPLCLWSP